MADAERGERIRDLRESRRLTQPAVVERMCRIGGARPDGRPFIGLRGYQKYEEGGGISWEKARVLAEALDVDEDYILRGEGNRRQVRSARQIDTDLAERLAAIEERMDAPAAVDRVEGELEERIARIEERLQEAASERQAIRDLLERQDRILERIEDAIRREDALRQLLDASAARVDAAVETALRLLPTSESAPRSGRRARSKTSS